jgi:hypothetical protein
LFNSDDCLPIPKLFVLIIITVVNNIFVINTVVTNMGEIRNAFETFVEKFKGKRPLERPIRTREDNIKMNLEMGCERVDWILLAQDRVQWRTLKASNLLTS